jgi:hypothetical protein
MMFFKRNSSSPIQVPLGDLVVCLLKENLFRPYYKLLPIFILYGIEQAIKLISKMSRRILALPRCEHALRFYTSIMLFLSLYYIFPPIIRSRTDLSNYFRRNYKLVLGSVTLPSFRACVRYDKSKSSARWLWLEERAKTTDGCQG